MTVILKISILKTLKKSVLAVKVQMRVIRVPLMLIQIISQVEMMNIGLRVIKKN